MPELPEVERVRRSIAARIVGARVVRAELRRADVCESFAAGKKIKTGPGELFEGAVVADVLRHGKQIAIVAHDGRVMCVHLGMTGHLAFVAVSGSFRNEEPHAEIHAQPHTHVRWELVRADNEVRAEDAEEEKAGEERGRVAHTGRRGSRRKKRDSTDPFGQMLFTDPRRFGGVWTFPSFGELKAARWDRLGPDALSIEAEHLIREFKASRRSVKAALLDQAVLAGVGNIYADEALFRAAIDPRSLAARLRPEPVRRLGMAIREILAQAIKAGGSTLRDFRDVDGTAGGYQRNHAVYGRAGLPCLVCARPLHGLVLAQRATVLCRGCQSRNAR